MPRKNIDPFYEATFNFRNRAARAVWGIVYLTVFRFVPRPFHGVRCFILRLFRAKIGKDCHVSPSVKIWAPWNLFMDDGSSLGDKVICYSLAPIILGKRAVVSQYTHLCTGSHDYRSPNYPIISLPIKIGSNAWVCADSFVGPGITIGEGSVVGARSVVITSLPDWMVCVGHPCKPIKPRIYNI